MLRLILVAALVLSPFSAVGEPRTDVRHSGRIHSLVPHEGVLAVEEYGAGGTVRILRVEFRSAVIVWVMRDADHPEQWHERPVRIAELPVGTFVVIHGRSRQGGVKAHRIDVPRSTSSGGQHRGFHGGRP